MHEPCVTYRSHRGIRRNPDRVHHSTFTAIFHIITCPSTIPWFVQFHCCYYYYLSSINNFTLAERLALTPLFTRSLNLSRMLTCSPYSFARFSVPHTNNYDEDILSASTHFEIPYRSVLWGIFSIRITFVCVWAINTVVGIELGPIHNEFTMLIKHFFSPYNILNNS